MKKLYLLLAIIFVSVLATACNYNLIDTNYTFDHAWINLNGEYQYIEISSWTDAEGEQLTVIGKDGTVYLTSSFNCTLVKEK